MRLSHPGGMGGRSSGQCPCRREAARGDTDNEGVNEVKQLLYKQKTLVITSSDCIKLALASDHSDYMQIIQSESINNQCK